MSNMFKTKCAECGKEMYTYAVDRQGTLPKVYCSKACKSNAQYKKRFKV